ncbi:hypothetical protein XENTR_v10012484 [Xenopus tropicalis]|uniref:Active regulator of SIRT1 n=1 Tax=Xenopus tropicalis TaxID=8364 RepID=AROS_XENTR|nr:active regulator of SIRT1 [Xenopus tropicalis]Q28IC1.1 RecName: Full=Active regulator of SIRT1; AltName: Full=40S ribosomal protein S19-binding protein 1; Short=RPS19-binding protein 1; Short=S19BP [Xenopus tropicalis]AAI55376.1 Active regulator of SIRT1 [Xenopus tropicalis]KAE8611509.1 hypothetical protein XENTR_v10012484 [Xenopus tropicalis]CAJ83072.1 novel protein [Xenopus tropicalis]|eukprot:NP_001037897.1 active regulator of SIRT1 [Xenopus tropicalis]
MSVSLLRKGLDLLREERSGAESSSKKRNSSSKPKPCLSSSKTGMRKQLRRLKQQGLRHDQKATAKGRVIRSAVEEFKKQSAKDHLQQNLQYMLDSSSVTSKEVVDKILKQNRGRKAKDIEIKQHRQIKEKSVFSDADFKRFELEYFGSK